MKNNLLFLLLFWGIIGCSDDDMSGSIYGTVLTKDGTTLVNATMSLYRLESYYDEYDNERWRKVFDQQKKTDNNGYYEFVNLSFVKKYQLMAELEGYGTFSWATFLKSERMNKDVVLRKVNEMIVLEEVGIAVQNLDVTDKIGRELAGKLCAESIVGGYDDWRLPTLSELSSMYNNKLLLPDIKFSTYWSSTNSSPYAYYVLDMTDGHIATNDDYWEQTHYARCVRSIQ